MKKYLKDYKKYLDKLTPSLILVAMTKVNWEKVKNLSFKRVEAADKTMGDSIAKKSKTDILKEAEEELSDWLFYYYKYIYDNKR